MLLTAAGSALAVLCGHAQTVRVWPGVAPGSEAWTWQERTVENTPIGTVVFNVVTPTLTAFLPERTKATGTGVIVAPGGAFVALAIDVEGYQVARWLQQRGIAAFVICASLVRQFEFAQNVWANDQRFHELGNERDPFIGTHDGSYDMTIPKRPIRRKIAGLPAFTTVKGGAYFFLPGIRALRFLANGVRTTSGSTASPSEGA